MAGSVYEMQDPYEAAKAVVRDDAPLQRTFTIAGTDPEMQVLDLLVQVLDDGRLVNEQRWRALAYLCDRFHMPPGGREGS